MYKEKYLKATKTIENSGKSDIVLVEIMINTIEIYENAKNGVRHGGVYRDALIKTRDRLIKSINSHTEQVQIREGKISNPMNYVKDWDLKTKQEKDGLLKKRRKDIIRNAEQAEIEKEVFRERFGEKL